MLNQIDYNSIQELLFHQLSNFWIDYDKKSIIRQIKRSVEETVLSFEYSDDRRIIRDGILTFNPYYSTLWAIFLYRLSYNLSKAKQFHEADLVYYLNKCMHSVDWFHSIVLPIHFGAEHPLGSVLGKANYGDFLFVYQGTTIGGNRKNGLLSYPTLGSRVVLFSNSSVLGNAIIGNNVVISANTHIINQIVPDNCIVFGISPNIVIKEKTEEEIQIITKSYWCDNQEQH